MTAAGLAAPTTTRPSRGDETGARAIPLRRDLPLLAILAAALAIRLAVAFGAFTIIHEDETYQYFEQAHRLVFGSGVVPWEFLDGVRSWLLPGVIAAVMAVSREINDSPWLYVYACRVGTILLSVSVVYVGARLIEVRAGRTAGLLTAALGAVWVDSIYYAPVVMSDTVATSVAFWAVWAGDDARGALTGRRLALSGALLGLAFCVRYQLVPVLGMVALWQARASWRRWLALAAGGLPVVLLLSGLLDELTLGSPFQSIWLNFTRNAIEGASAGFGTQTRSFYVRSVWGAWAPLSLPFAALALAGAVRVPGLALAAAALVVSHSLTAHKEYRFILFALLSVPIFFGAGIALLRDALARARVLTTNARRVAFCAVFGAYIALWSAGAATYGVPASLWHRSAGFAEAMARAGRRPDLCGVALLDDSQFLSGGYTYLNRDVPLFMPPVSKDPHNLSSRFAVVWRGRVMSAVPFGALVSNTSAYNDLIGIEGQSYPGYGQVACFDNAGGIGQPSACLFERAGGCPP